MRLERLAVACAWNEHPGPCHAGLAAVEEGVADTDLHRSRQVCTLEDHVGRLPAQFECDLLDCAPSQFGHPCAHCRGAGEGHQVDVGVLGDAFADDRAGARHQIEHAGGQTRIGDGFDELEHRQRSLVARLEYDGAACGDRRQHLGHHLVERVVPRGDRTDDAIRFPHHQGIADPLLELEGIEDVSDAAGHREGDLGLHGGGDPHGRAHLGGDGFGDLGESLLHRRDHRGHPLPSLGDGDHGVERAGGGGHRGVDVGFRASGHAADDPFCCGIDDLDRVAAIGDHPLTVDVQRGVGVGVGVDHVLVGFRSVRVWRHG